MKALSGLREKRPTVLSPVWQFCYLEIVESLSLSLSLSDVTVLWPWNSWKPFTPSLSLVWQWVYERPNISLSSKTWVFKGLVFFIFYFLYFLWKGFKNTQSNTIWFTSHKWLFVLYCSWGFITSSTLCYFPINVYKK